MGGKRVARRMRELGIEGVTRRRFKTATTRNDAQARPARFVRVARCPSPPLEEGQKKPHQTHSTPRTTWPESEGAPILSQQ